MAVHEANKKQQHVSTLEYLTFEGLDGCGVRGNKKKLMINVGRVRSVGMGGAGVRSFLTNFRRISRKLTKSRHVAY